MKDTRLYHTIVQSILEMLETDGYSAGMRLPGERDLAKRFGVSRVVVREAEIFLEAIGRLRIRGGSGAYVVDAPQSSHSSLPDVTPFGLTQTRLLFEPECAAMAAIMITDAQIAELDATVELMAVAPLGSPEADKADHAFHLLIAKATGNEANVAILQNIWRMRTEIDAVKSVYLAVGHTDSSERVHEHTEIMEALRNRDPIAARHAMRRHFSRLLGALLDVSEQNAIEDARQKSNQNRERYLHLGVGG